MFLKNSIFLLDYKEHFQLLSCFSAGIYTCTVRWSLALAHSLKKQPPQNGLNLDDLVALPSDLLTNLEQAIAELDREMIYQVIEEIRPHDTPLADALKVLADNFQYDKILTFIQK